MSINRRGEFTLVDPGWRGPFIVDLDATPKKVLPRNEYRGGVEFQNQGLVNITLQVSPRPVEGYILEPGDMMSDVPPFVHQGEWYASSAGAGILLVSEVMVVAPG